MQTKIANVSSQDYENDHDLLDALKEVSASIPYNTANARRQLRGKLEQATLDVDKQLLGALETLVSSVDAVYDDIKKIHGTCNSMQIRLKNLKSQSRPFIVQAQKLQSERAYIEKNEQDLEALLARYQLSESELRVLQSQQYPYHQSLNMDFFQALDRVLEIQKSLDDLSKEGFERLSQEIAKNMENIKEAAFDRLFKWCQVQVRVTDVNDVHPLLRRSLQFLETYPTYIEHLFEEYASARQSVVLRQFQEAVAKMEDRSDDPSRFLGDILAWIHQTSLTEIDALNSVLKFGAKSGLEGIKQKAISRLTDGLSGPFFTRTSAVVFNKELDLETISRIAALACFYSRTFAQALPATSSLLISVQDFCLTCFTRIADRLSSCSSQIVEFIRVPTADLCPPPDFQLFLSTVSDILTTLNACQQVPSEELVKIANAAVEPILAITADQFSSLSRMDEAVYVTNLLDPVYKTSVAFEFLEDRTESLESQIARHVATISAVYTTELLQVLGLAGFLPALSGASGSDLETKKFDPASLQQLSERIRDLDFAGGSELTTLRIVPSEKKQVIKTSINAVASVYEQLYSTVNDASLLDISPESLVEILKGLIM